MDAVAKGPMNCKRLTFDFFRKSIARTDWQETIQRVRSVRSLRCSSPVGSATTSSACGTAQRPGTKHSESRSWWSQAESRGRDGARRYGVTHWPLLERSRAEPFLRQAEAAADQLGIKLAASPIHSDVEIDRTIAELGSAQGGGLVVLPDPVTNTHSALIISLAAQYRVPTIYAWQFQARGGGLMSYGTDIADSFRAAASYADRIIRGETVASLPVQTPTKFYLVINRKTAKALNLNVPATLLAAADEVIE
jgi:hypothetical protein